MWHARVYTTHQKLLNVSFWSLRASVDAGGTDGRTGASERAYNVASGEADNAETNFNVFLCFVQEWIVLCVCV